MAKRRTASFSNRSHNSRCEMTSGSKFRLTVMAPGDAMPGPNSISSESKHVSSICDLEPPNPEIPVGQPIWTQLQPAESMTSTNSCVPLLLTLILLLHRWDASRHRDAFGCFTAVVFRPVRAE